MKIVALEKDKYVLQKVLGYLETLHPREYKVILKNIKVIAIKDDKKRSDNRVFPDKSKYVMYSGLLYGYDHIKEHVASLLIHEAYHITQYKNGVRNIDNRAERGAYLKQLKFLKKVKCGSLVKYVSDYYDETYTENSRKKSLL